MQYKCQYYEQKNLNILGGKKSSYNCTSLQVGESCRMVNKVKTPGAI